MLYQMDACGGGELDEIRESLMTAAEDPSGKFEGAWSVPTVDDPTAHRKAFDIAQGAWETHDEADRLATEVAPAWPTARQPAMDRNVIRLCWYEMTKGGVPPKVAVNEAIELAKEFGTERSAPFLNGVLDKLLRRVLREGGSANAATAETPATPDADEVEHTEYWSSEQ